MRTEAVFPFVERYNINVKRLRRFLVAFLSMAIHFIISISNYSNNNENSMISITTTKYSSLQYKAICYKQLYLVLGTLDFSFYSFFMIDCQMKLNVKKLNLRIIMSFNDLLHLNIILNISIFQEYNLQFTLLNGISAFFTEEAKRTNSRSTVVRVPFVTIIAKPKFGDASQLIQDEFRQRQRNDD
jgi:hypothetical protein